MDSLQQAAGDTGSVDARIAASLQRLNAQGVSYNRISDRLATTEVALDLGEVTRATQVIDLTVGLPMQIVYYREDGAVDMKIDRVFQSAGGVPYVAHSVTYEYGDVEGSWSLVSRTETTREDVRVTFN